MKYCKKAYLILLSLILFTQISFAQNNDEANQLFKLINDERKKSGLNEYKTETQLQNAADQRVKEIAADEVFAQMLKSQRNLILNNKFTHAATSVYENNGKKYWVMIYVVSRNDSIVKQELNIQKERERVVELCNEARKQNNVSVSLVLDAKLSEAAQKRAEELIKLFSHTRPNRTDFSTVLKEYNINYKTAGENIANGQFDADDVMNSWLKSPGHRANILQKNFGKIGVGVFEYNGRLYWVQVFTN